MKVNPALKNPALKNPALNVLADPLNMADYTTYFTPDAVAELFSAAESMNRKAMRKFIDNLEKKYKTDMKKIVDRMAADLDKAKDEMHEEIGHYYMGTMYVLVVLAMKNAKLSDRTVMRVLNLISGTLNDLDEEKITITDIKDAAEAFNIKVVFDVNRHFIKANMYERDIRDGKAEEESNEK